jgi:hypothetical protein
MTPDEYGVWGETEQKIRLSIHPFGGIAQRSKLRRGQFNTVFGEIQVSGIVPAHPVQKRPRRVRIATPCSVKT